MGWTWFLLHYRVMLFNSHIFIFLFLPVVVFGYFLLGKHKHEYGKRWLILASLFFYGYWNIHYIPLILISVFVNYLLGQAINNSSHHKKRWLILGCIFNLGLLGFFKYADFFIENLNLLTDSNVGALHIILPLAISFFTFQQISYLADKYYGQVKERDPESYVLYVLFFPQLIAGPIVHHSEMMPQFSDPHRYSLNWNNIARGMYVFVIGLGKKVIVADTFANWVHQGFDVATSLNFTEAWLVSIGYSLQLYFDFSGYTDMAIGAALMFNIVLPLNFNSPYKALDIQDFWRRWHMTLSRFLRDYLYIPLGGNQSGPLLTYRNLFLTFLLGGLWHGAAWTFVFWGVLHGLGTMVHRLWKQAGMNMPKPLAWVVTFSFVNLAFVFFRAESWADAMKVVKGMAGLSGFALPHTFKGVIPQAEDWGITFGHMLYQIKGDWITVLWVITFLLVSTTFKNSNQMSAQFKTVPQTFVYTICIAIVALLMLNRMSAFLYFQF